ncbi:MAG: hypothetical protein GWP91_06100, partial [Rhodobacterales bacterium]|nr:hypothetical protein [Rhodobacterales bacterium]
CTDAVEPCDQAWWQDADADGFGGREQVWIGCEPPSGYVAGDADCNDDEAAQFPGAQERCDGADTNCDGLVDNEAVDQPTFYRDFDGDGFGDSTDVQSTCQAEAGFVDNGNDCDDTAAEISPDADEYCDAVDHNCDEDSLLDAVDAPLWFEDVDVDGYAGFLGIAACEHPGDGWYDSPGDCDDLDPTVNPTATEVPADGFDQDCDAVEDCWADTDGDGVGGTDVASGSLDCTSPGVSASSGDCNDVDASVGLYVLEVPWDGVDNDCNPLTPDDDIDGDGYPLSSDCDDEDPMVNPVNPPAIVFADITAASGLDRLQWDPIAEPYRCSGGEEWMSGGAAVADFDGDGRLDLFLPRMYLPDLLYRALPAGDYEEVGAQYGVDDSGPSNGALFVDVDGDGDLDLVVTMMGAAPNLLYVNEGAFFSEESVLRGVDLPLADPSACSLTTSVSAGDVDGDGDLDLLLAAWQRPDLLGTERAALLVNDGFGFFTEDMTALGMDLNLRAGFTGAFIDFDDDGDVDLGLAADWASSGLYQNDGGSFTDVTATASVGTDENGMGADWADVNGDGHLDWFVTSVSDDTVPCSNNWGCSGNRLYLSDGAGGFTDGTDDWGLRDGDWGWGARFFDVDHDGDLDLAQQNGMPHPGFTEDSFRLWINQGIDYEDESCSRGTFYAGQGRGVVTFDQDNDGDQDLLLTFTGDLPRLLRNDDGASQGAWLRVSLVGPSPNTFGVGATVRFLPADGGNPLRRDLHANSTFLASGPPEVHVGLGENVLADVEITWPEGTVQLLVDQPVNQHLTVQHPSL